MIRVYYWTGKKNFGDLLTPLLLKRFAKVNAQLVGPKEAQLVMVGSLLEHLPEDYSGIIFGSGKLHEKTQLKFPKATVLTVRGPLTARGFRQTTWADAALLSDELVPLEDKKYNLGIIPHWTDTELEHNKTFKNFDPHIIRVTDDPLKVIREIGLCKKIVSSSLHGIIIADAFNIPRRIEIAPKMLSLPNQEGGLFKWRDYSASLGVELEIGVTQLMDRHAILEKQYLLFDKFEELKKLLR